MALSDQEQQLLKEIEQSLYADDPKFGTSVSGNRAGAVTIQGVAVFVVGLCLLVGGIALAQNSFWFIGISVVGFLVMFFAGVWMLQTTTSATKAKKPGLSATLPGAGHASHQSSFGSRIEENFRRRFENPDQ